MDEIYHVGKDHIESKSGPGSGRYEFGSGNRPHQHDWDLKSRYEKLHALGSTPAEIAAQLGFYQYHPDGSIKTDKDGNPLGSTTKLRAEMTLATAGVKADEYAEVSYYINSINPATGKNYTQTEIGRIIGRNESSVRSILATGEAGKKNKVQQVADKLREEASKKKYLDVTAGSELYLGCSTERLNSALELLKKEGYTVEIARLNQVSNKQQQTTFKVLCAPGVEGNIQRHMSDVQILDDPDPTDHNNDMNKAQIFSGDPPEIALSRVQIRYDEQGGTRRDGQIEIRAVRDENGKLVAASPDLSLGNAQYAQIRIGVEGDRYIKGMAVYNEDLPEGVDIRVNSNKSEVKGVDKALKEMKKDADGNLLSQPFGSTVVPTCCRNPDGSPMLDKDGNQIRSAINFVGANMDDAHVEGRWGTYSKNLPAQFLAKQTLPLVKKQLKLDANATEQELEEIMQMNNPVVKQQMLIDFGDTADRKAVDLKAAPITGQRTRVLLAVDSLKNNEAYCPGLPDGTTVALVRFPHSGPHEIPICQVNNRNREASKFMKNAPDAIGINKDVADRLSGADFDGDTAIVIPMTKKNPSTGEFDKITNIISNPVLPHMEGFDTTAAYSTDNPRFANMQAKGSDGKMHPTFKYFKTDKEKGKEMGVVSNLITDMYAKGCSDPEELSRALRYSMVVIDAKKHELNYQQAAKDFNIDELKQIYQDKGNGKHGASSLLSQAKSPIKIDKRAIWQPVEAKLGSDGKIHGGIDPKTGEKIYQKPQKTEEWKREPVKVLAPAGYVWRDSSGKAHRSKYMKDENGKDVEETYTGQIKQKPDGSYYYDKGNGKVRWVNKEKRPIQEEVPKMSLHKDARDLLSQNPSEIEQTYAVYANHMKSLANKARLAAIQIHTDKGVDPVAKKKYAKEVQELDAALIKAKKNAPRERQAQILATSRINAIFSERDDLDSDDRRKIRGQCLSDARKDTGASKARVKFTEKQWEAVNARAISASKLKELLKNADKENYTNLARPKQNRITDQQKALVKSLYAKNAGADWEEIANRAGVSLSSVYNIINE